MTWRWDELSDDDWVSSNYQYAITGDYNGWNHAPRVQFIDGDGNGSIVETSHNAGLLPVNMAPVIENSIADISVEQNAADITVDVYSAFADVETLDENLSFTVEISNPALVSYSLAGGTLTLSFTANSSGTSLVAINASDDDSTSPLSVSQTFNVEVHAPIVDYSDWYIDAVNGDDATGNGSLASPLQSLSGLLALNTTNPGYVGIDDTVYLAAGDYGSGSNTIDIAGLSLEGTLDINGESLTEIGNLEITA